MESKLGDRIKEARTREKLTQAKLAQMLEIAEPTLNKYEKGHRIPDATLLSRIANILKCDPGWLLTGIKSEIHEPSQTYFPEITIIKSEHASGQYPLGTEEIWKYVMMVSDILRSGTGYANALKENIAWFHDAVKNKRDLDDLKERVKLLEEQLPPKSENDH